MRIAFFVPGFPALTETFLFNQIVDFIDKGHEVDIYATNMVEEGLVHNLVQEYQLIKRTIYLERLPEKRAGKILRLLSWLLKNISIDAFTLILNCIKNSTVDGLSVYYLSFFNIRRKYDVVHAHFGKMGVFVSKYHKQGLFKNSKLITTFHGYDLEETSEDVSQYSLLYDRCDYCTVNSNYSKNKLLRLGCPERKTHVIPVGLDLNYFVRESSAEPEKKYFTILFVGRLVNFKAPDLVIKISSRLKNRNFKDFNVFIVGEGELYTQLDSMIQEENLQENVFLLGSKSQQDIKNLMQSASVFLYPGIIYKGRAENQGLVIQEAQAMELPVIVSDAGGAKEGIMDQETGFIVPEGNLDEFVLKIETLASNPILSKNMGLSGRKFVMKNYSIDVINNRFIDLYKA